MSNDMRSWRPITSRLASNVKSYLNSRDSAATPRAARPRDTEDTPRNQSWGQWAGEKLKGISGNDGGSSGVHKLSLFPGWAARRYTQTSDSLREEPFHVDLFVSGFAVSYTSPGNASRSQKAFIRLAKGFANLPKIAGTISPTQPSPPIQLTPSTEDLLKQIHLPPRPTEITEESEVQALEEHFRNLELESASVNSDASSMMSRTSSSSSMTSTPSSSRSDLSRPVPSANTSSMSVHQLHLNLEQRLQPFWSSTLGSRPVRLSLFTAPCNPDNPAKDELGNEPVAVQKVKTGVDGSFQWRFSLPYDQMCTHPGALEVVFGDPMVEHDFYVLAELLPQPPPEQVQTAYAARQVPARRASVSAEPTAIAQIKIPLSHCPVRVISDIDDTVKKSSILSGARAVFHNVFVKDLRDIVIPGMGEWYTRMWNRGVRFHYVSNGPFELLPVLSEFFAVSSLPPGSIKLKSYAGRSLFNGLLSAPAQRKRAGVAEILDNFCDSRFFLIGDSGEQDLELYATMAAERPQQILAIFIRDVNQSDEGIAALDDPLGTRRPSANVNAPSTPGGGKLAATARTVRHPKRAMSDLLTPTTPREKMSSYFVPSRSRSRPSSLSSVPTTPTDYFSSQGDSESAPSSPTMHDSPLGGPSSNPSALKPGDPRFDPEATPMPDNVSTFSAEDVPTPGAGRTAATQGMSPSERRRFELQQRLYKARALVPAHIPLRIFREPQECIEAARILDKLFVGTQPEVASGSEVQGPES